MKHSKSEIREVREQIKDDQSLKSAAKMLTYTSIVCIALASSGASIHKANTFLFEIEFNNPVGLKLLLLLSLVILLIKYHTNAYSHFRNLEEIENDRLLENREIFFYNSKFDEYKHGLLGIASMQICYDDNKYSATDFRYKRKLFFRRYLEFTMHQHEDSAESQVIKSWQDRALLLGNKECGLKLPKYIRLLWLDFKNRINCWLNYPEHLTLLLPYITGVAAIAVIAMTILAPDVFPTFYELFPPQPKST